MTDTFKILTDLRQDNFFNVCASCKSICCKGAKPPLTSERLSIMKKYLSAERISIEKPFKRNKYSFPREVPKGYCIFFNIETARCKMHLLKPETCVAGPITFDIDIGKGNIEWYLKSEKICQLAGILYRNKNKLRRHMESAKREINILIEGLSKKELLAILCIEEQDTFKIGEDPLNSKILTKLR